MFSGFTKKNGKIIMRFIFHRLSADGFSRGKEARKKIIIKRNFTMLGINGSHPFG